MELELAIADRLAPELCESFTRGFSRLFVPPEQMVKEWVEKDPTVYFTSEEEKNEFFEYLKEESDDESDDESEYECDERVSKYVELAGTRFAQHVLVQVFPLILSADGHPPFWQSDDETCDERKTRIYDRIHSIIYDYFLALFTDLDTQEVSDVVKGINETVCDADDRFDVILNELKVDNEYAAKAVRAATDSTCGQLVDALVTVAPEIQANLQQLIVTHARKLALL